MLGNRNVTFLQCQLPERFPCTGKKQNIAVDEACLRQKMEISQVQNQNKTLGEVKDEEHVLTNRTFAFDLLP